MALFGTGRSAESAVSPWLIDSDQDGIPTLWEIVQGLDPYDPSDALLDPDGDNFNNRAEYQAGTDPHSAESVLRFTRVQQIAFNKFFLQFQAVPNRAYSVVYRTDFQSTNWIKIQDFEAAPTNRLIEWTDIIPTERSDVRFYNVFTRPIP